MEALRELHAEKDLQEESTYRTGVQFLVVVVEPDKVWNEVLDIVQETGIKTIPKKKMQKCKMAL